MIASETTINKLVNKLINDPNSVFNKNLNYPSPFQSYFMNSVKITRKVIKDLRKNAEKYNNASEVFQGLVEHYIAKTGVTEAYNMTTFLLNSPNDPSLQGIYNPNEEFRNKIVEIMDEKLTQKIDELSELIRGEIQPNSDNYDNDYKMYEQQRKQFQEQLEVITLYK